MRIEKMLYDNAQLARVPARLAGDGRAVLPHDRKGDARPRREIAIVGNPNAADTRARPRGTWRSNLYEYAALSDWLPDVDLASVTPSGRPGLAGAPVPGGLGAGDLQRRPVVDRLLEG